MSKISRVTPLPHLDSQGGLTIKVVIELQSGATGWGAVPKGATPEKLRNLGITHLEESEDAGGAAAEEYVHNFRRNLAPKLVGLEASNQESIDNLLSDYNTKEDWSLYGVNVMLAASIAVARAAAREQRMELYQYIAGLYGQPVIESVPVPMTTVLEGGPRIGNNLDAQAVIIVPVGALSVNEAHLMTDAVFFKVQELMRNQDPPLNTSVGEQGGFVPIFWPRDKRKDDSWLEITRQALDLVVNAVEAAGFRLWEDFCLAIDFAMTGQIYNPKTGTYSFRKSARQAQGIVHPEHAEVASDDLLNLYREICGSHAVLYIEDPFHQSDTKGWNALTRGHGSSMQIVGDDLFYDFAGVLSPRHLLRRFSDSSLANGIVIMPNRASTLTGCISLIQLAQSLNYTTIMSVRARETEDDAIVDIAAGCGVSQIRCGGLQCTERNSKFDRLRLIEELSGHGTRYAGDRLLTVASSGQRSQK